MSDDLGRGVDHFLEGMSSPDRERAANVPSRCPTVEIDGNGPRDPKVTLTLLKLNAVVGLRGFFRGGRLASVGVTCAVCDSTVDDS